MYMNEESTLVDYTMNQIRINSARFSEIQEKICKCKEKKEKLEKRREKVLKLIIWYQNKYNVPYGKTPLILRNLSENMWYEISLLTSYIYNALTELNKLRTINDGPKKKLIKYNE